ncbi:MAG: metalloprotease PmbA [Proteobacteria bacterium]|nr:MAG: metalloprotease PmbA [Pseudomonadota bacterium]MBC6945688.1 metalloprotease PmbA [Gammaproteobacteria bacterium]MCE7897383.1 metalloprotease PmbA [Gammaproteobacteria bacterium PRO8]MCQ3933582.1 metalloprotease PmbA [Gammaproteobacteria bacterium]MDL1881387.1 metalloprotease PmbA [Gammaproteobacteria bacterium PRO2]
MTTPAAGHDVADLQARVAEVLALARRLGASQAEASASFGTGLSVTVRMRSVETLEYQRDQGIGVTLYFGQRKGSASTSDLRPAAIEESVRKAASLARYAAEDACAGLAEPERLAREIPDLDLWHPWSLDADAAIDLAMRCEAAALDHDPRITNSEGAAVGSHDGARAYGNSHGFLAGYRETSHSLSCAVLASQGQQMERDFEFTAARDPVELAAARVVGREAASRALARLGAVKLDTRNAPVLYPARLARGLVGHLVGALSGAALYRRASFLLDSLGTRVLAPHLSIDERPHLPRGLASAPFDDEGVATVDRRLVDAGVIQGYVLGSYSARKLGMASTGNAGGTHNLLVSSSAGAPTFDELLAELGTGFLVTELMGSGVNPVTGDYSRGATGFWVEGGVIRFPVSEVTIAGNLRDMYRDIVAVGGDVDVRGGIRSGSILVREMTIAGS